MTNQRSTSKEMATPAATAISSAAAASTNTSTDSFSSHLPFRLLKSELIPPNPNKSQPPSSVIDWLPDFAGYSWIAYGAASLLVISHFPSPWRTQESDIGPIFRQVIELGNDGDVGGDDVEAVAWSMETPSMGEVAAAAGDRVVLFANGSAEGSFSWSQIAVLRQSSKAEAIRWTGSGDGIFCGGMEVVLWKRNNRSWEIAWKFGMKLAQTLVSTTWKIDGPSASGVYSPELDDKGTSSSSNSPRHCVTVYQSGGKSGYVVSELQHPQPVLAIQWRHCSRKQLKEDAVYPHRHVLLTCSVDGAVRLWSETEDGRARKSDKNFNNPKIATRSFHVSAVIEINQTLDGDLGSNIHISWPLEVASISSVRQGMMDQLHATEHQDNNVGRCEWLVALGPGKLVTFWAVHCIDDIAPTRAPRVTLWKKIELKVTTMAEISDNYPSDSRLASILLKVAISRNQLFGPPVLCSLIQLLPCSTLVWSVLYSRPLAAMEDRPLNDKPGKCSDLFENSREILNIGGHAGKVLQVSVHPHKSEVNLAASLDSNGSLLLWSFYAGSNCISGLATLNPSWKMLGKLDLEEDMLSQSVKLNWAPSWLDEVHILLVGHNRGIDCIVIRSNDSNGEKIQCHKICSIPFFNDELMHSPEHLFSTSLSSPYKTTIGFSRFLVIGVWRKGFQALSWKITLYSYDLNGTGVEDDSDIKGDVESRKQTFESEFAGKRYCMIVCPCSSIFPDSDSLDHVTSVAVVNPTILMPSLQQARDPVDDSCLSCLAYHMVTGHSGGRVKLWRSITSNSSVSQLPWELVGMFTAPSGSVTAISVADFGQKIATKFSAEHTYNGDKVCVWEAANLAGAGCFVVEDTVTLKGRVLGLSWLTMGTGQLFLGICLMNEVHVYAQRRCNSQSLLNANSSGESSWLCISIVQSSAAILDFFWGPMMTLVVIHEKFFSIFSSWSLLKRNPMSELQRSQDNSLQSRNELDRGTLAPLSGFEIYDLGKALADNCCGDYTCCPALGMNEFQEARSVSVKRAQSTDELFVSILEAAGILCGSLPFYHPKALSLNILSGNWKRAIVALRHLVECVAATSGVEGSMLSAESDSSITSVRLSNYFEGIVASGGSNGDVFPSRNDNLMTSANFGGALAHFTNNAGSGAFDNSYVSSANTLESGSYIEAYEKLHDLSAISNLEKLKALSIIDLLDEISSSKAASMYNSLDEPGKRFWSSVRLQQLDISRRYSRMASIEELDITSSLIACAFHSDCQETLFGSILSAEPSWLEMRKIGVGFWYSDAAQLRRKMEKLARLQYLKNKDPKACALLYIALNRIQVLAGLFKISRDEKDKPLVAFLSRNFQEEKHKAAALKNAYVLMGRHQLELAIAFFLLGGDTMSATSVCAKNLGDEQLALVICHLVEGKGGPLEQHLISKIILPSAIEKDDYWLASILQWMLGSYQRSFECMLGFRENSWLDGAVYPFKHAALHDPSIGQYCQTLAAKNSLRNAVGEQNAALLSRWAIVMTAAALKKSGHPLEALECLSSSDQKGITGNSEGLLVIHHPLSTDDSNWISTDVASLLEDHVKSDLAMQHISELLLEHPSWIRNKAFHNASSYFLQHGFPNYETLAKNFQAKLNSMITYVEQRFSLIPNLLLNKIIVSSSNHGLSLLGYQIVHGFDSSHNHSPLIHQPSNDLVSFDTTDISVTAKDVLHLVSRFVCSCSLIIPQTTPSSSPVKTRGLCHIFKFYIQGILLALCRLKASFMTMYVDSTKGAVAMLLVLLDFCIYLVFLISSELHRDVKALTLLVKPLFDPSPGGRYDQIDSAKLREMLIKVVKLASDDILDDSCCIFSPVALTNDEHGGSHVSMIPKEERWRFIEMCLWQHKSRFLAELVNRLLDTKENFHHSVSHVDESSPSMSALPEPKSSLDNLYQVCVMLAESIGNMGWHMSFYHSRQLGAFLWQKMEDGCAEPYLQWLKETSKLQVRGLPEHMHRSYISSPTANGGTLLQCPELFWDICLDPKVVKNGLAQVGIHVSELIRLKSYRGWRDFYSDFIWERDTLETRNPDGVSHEADPDGGNLLPSSPQLHDGRRIMDSGKRGPSFLKRVVAFHNPVEIYKRNGELFEALCINSVDQRRAAVASNRKGIAFLKWDDGLPVKRLSDYIWSEADWPWKECAGVESAPGRGSAPPGVDRGDSNESNLQSAGAKGGVSTVVRPGRDLTGGGAFGIPGYAGIGASGLGWQMQGNSENLVDSPATLETISAKAFASHPSRPLFLVGSSYTRTYLWEFGEDKAAATYRVHPADVPPPSALADVTTLSVDCCGHRFANGSSDGIVRTWQLEVGGRSNVGPTESSLCFNGSAADVCYVSTSGSVVAAAGYSSNGVNVVIWDTLAPSSTSRASVMCHEGGACSIAVFDKDVGSGSITPLIVTGGKGGDVGLHDFRYIATGKTRRNKPLNADERISNASPVDIRPGVSHSMGDHNRNGMLWYIPKAHSGAVTKISAIPNTSLFLTGSKDGDVKLWDAKTANLVYHWPKLHEKHTFLQWGFGGIARIAVTDIQVVSNGFLSCGGDGTVKLVRSQNLASGAWK